MFMLGFVLPRTRLEYFASPRHCLVKRFKEEAIALRDSMVKVMQIADKVRSESRGTTVNDLGRKKRGCLLEQ